MTKPLNEQTPPLEKYDASEDAENVIRGWMERSPFSETDMARYMEAMARRAQKFIGARIPTDDTVEFVSRMREVLAVAEEISREIEPDGFTSTKH